MAPAGPLPPIQWERQGAVVKGVWPVHGTAPDIAGLESLAVKFEDDHPALAEGLRRLADTLAKAGI